MRRLWVRKEHGPLRVWDSENKQERGSSSVIQTLECVKDFDISI